MHLPSISDSVHSEAAPWIERLARVGFAAKALLYMTVGALAALAALGEGGKANTDQRGALLSLLEAPMGRVLLAVIAVGLAGYALWRIIEGISDPERYGKSAKGLAKRARSVITGLIHGGLAISAGKLVIGMQADRGGARAQHWTAKALAEPGGKIAVMLAAAAFIGYGLYQLYSAAASKLDKRLALDSLSSAARRVVVGISRAGIASRGIVFGMIGVMLFRAANDGNPNEAGGVARSLGELFEFGKWPFLAIAVGLIAYGGYQLLNARYRRIHVQ